MLPIPAIDIIDGKCVRLTQGDYARKTVYNDDPLEVARAFEEHGLRHLHLVDLDGAHTGRIINHRVLERLAARTSLLIDYGGGVKSSDDLRLVFECGARQATIGTVAAQEPALFLEWLQQYGPEQIVLSADVRDGLIAIGGWLTTTGIDLFDFLDHFAEQGVQYVTCTDISKDGLMQGTAHGLYRSLRARWPGLQLIASGGVSALSDLDELRDIGCFGAIIGKAIYEGGITLPELQRWTETV